jgi:hypothetical protein
VPDTETTFGGANPRKLTIVYQGIAGQARNDNQFKKDF